MAAPLNHWLLVSSLTVQCSVNFYDYNPMTLALDEFVKDLTGAPNENIVQVTKHSVVKRILVFNR